MTWEIVIGIETHVQLATRSKIFSNASTAFGAPPNTQASVVDLALPGTLPVMNKQAVEFAIKFGLAVNDGQTHNIARRSIFARKNYFYPDLPKGYQISQFELPVVTGGFVDIQVGEGEKATTKRINLTRAHLEEDAGKSLHEGLETPGVSGIDLNRAGTPLLEIVSEPEMRSAAEAVAYAKALHGLVTWIGICDGNMQEGSFRCDANVSVRRIGEPLGTRCEIKNLNSFRFMERAINYEVRRQIELIEDGGKVIQQTRLYDADRDETRAMRSKEDAMDYRYFPDPDLLPLAISDRQIETTRLSMLRGGVIDVPASTRQQLIDAYELSAYDAQLLTQSRAFATCFFAAFNSSGEQAKLCANWINGELASQLNREGIELVHSPVNGDQLGRLVKRIADGTLSSKMAKQVFGYMWAGEHGADADAIIEARGLKQVTDSSAIEKVIDDVLAKNEKSVAEFKSGKDKAIQALIGQVMKASQGKANPGQVNELLRKKLAE
ncbi:MAG: Asp-tRNA(Asn)/Glu-tRNA(Gln) amidotransferase subunit GatB [Rhodocyclaceae bacterium]|nr:Asp-tRNA(Asn)/Glu-tRNA(Gln) amidotransferase subunit GatB [Rhodocyclaceae bacterium]MCA3082851.1 Asp-tRNA(Asn)/Glu-tRNA(Gln) amidotransferase subunit GatB [Rhodocyclaceae bacterium]